MSANIDLSDILSIDFEGIVSEELQDTSNAILVELTGPPPEGTPIKSRTASNGWQTDYSQKLSPELYNTVPYIGRLNRGWSKQSGAGFVERACDKHIR